LPELALQEIHHHVVLALLAAGTDSTHASIVADALVAAEADGIASHGLVRLPDYVAQLRSGKLNGQAHPQITRTAKGIVRVDANSGFAYPAILQGLEIAVPVAREQGIVAMPVARSHHFGVAGMHVEYIARHGLVGIALGNSPAAIAPWGGKRPLFGTNVLAFGFPRAHDAPLVIDLALSVAARGKLVLAAKRHEPIPAGWAIDAEGHATTDPQRGLEGSLLPIGGHKGALLALAVEILAAALVGSRFGYEASSFFEADGSPPHVGQLFILIDPNAFGVSDYASRLEMLIETLLADPSVRLPGARRRENREQAELKGVAIDNDLWARVRALAGADSSLNEPP